MLFNSYTFLFAFLPLAVLGFALLSRAGVRFPLILWVLALSLVFYGWWNPVYLVLLVGSVVANFFIGRTLADAAQAGERNRVLLFAGVVLNLGLIGWFKYLGFFAGISDALMGSSFGVIEVALPLAISFFTFQQIAYLVDCHKGLAGERNIFRYGLFVTFFPQLIAGPIVHHSEMMGQFDRAFARGLTPLNVSVGFTLIAVGLFKKVVIADNLAVYATPVFASADGGAEIGFLEAWSGALAYTLQIYFDFSGYSDMAVGLARVFGIRLPLNFFSPYKATNIVDFWRRWHITLSRFLRDYVYIPLGGNRHGRARRHVNLMTTMLLGGLWHGAGWTFVVWGALHGIYLVINHGWRHVTAGKSWAPSGYWWTVVAWMLTFVSVVVAWVFFRAETFAGAWAMIHGMAGLNGLHDGAAIGQRVWRWIAGGLLIAVLMPNIYQIMARYRPVIVSPMPIRAPRFFRWRPVTAWACGTGALALAAILLLTQVSEFLYFRF